MDIEKELINDLAGIRGAIETQEGIYIPLEEVKKLLRNRIQQVKNSCLDGVSKCTHCYGTGKDHGDELMKTDCPSCK